MFCYKTVMNTAMIVESYPVQTCLEEECMEKYVQGLCVSS